MGDDSYPGPYGELLTNFVNNSLVHAFDEGTTGTLRITAKLVAGLQLDWTFSDDGKGISADNLNKVFDPFFTTQLGKGSNGLGLSISYNIATALFGGHLEAHSAAGSGTQFRWKFPVTAPHA